MANKTLRAIIVDDEPLARERLKNLVYDLEDEPEVIVVAEASTGEAALAKAVTIPADVVLLDISMPGMGGLEAARHISAIPHAPAIIFVTAYDAHALHAFELRAVDYLVKPVRLARLKEALLRIRPLSMEIAAELAPKRTHFTVVELGRVWQVAVDSVLFLRAELRYVTARTREREYLLDDSLVKLEEELGDDFLRVHRNCLVARRHLIGFERVQSEGEPHWQAVLTDWPERLPVSRRQAHVVRDFKGR